MCKLWRIKLEHSFINTSKINISNIKNNPPNRAARGVVREAHPKALREEEDEDIWGKGEFWFVYNSWYSWRPIESIL